MYDQSHNLKRAFPLSPYLEEHAREAFRRLRENTEKRIYNLSLSHYALLLLLHEGSFVAVESTPESARALYHDFLFFKSILSHHHTASGALFQPVSGPQSGGERAKVLLNFKREAALSLIASKESLQSGYSFSEIDAKTLTLSKGEEIAREGIKEWLNRSGYRNVSLVMEQGEYSERAWIIDVYPTTEETPFRIEFFGDTIELIRAFEVDTQRSMKAVGQLTLFPANGEELQYDILDELLSSKDALLFFNQELGSEEQDGESLSEYSDKVIVSHLPFVSEGIDSGEHSLKGLGILPEERKGIEELVSLLSQRDEKVVVVLPSHAQAERFRELFHTTESVAPLLKAEDVGSYDGTLCITVGTLSSGLRLDNVLFLTDKEIYGERIPYRPLKKSKVSKLLLSIDDLSVGDFIVHKDHGIGRFVGLQRQKTEEYEEDLITIEYANGDRLYVPFHSIEKIQKYSAGEGHTPSIDRLGGKTWQRTTQRARQGIQELAEKLLTLYAERKANRGFSFSEDTSLHHEFDDFFPYEETPDQIKAIDEIKKHMQSEIPMDMLLCGDVGYGKTEVAIKAAFRAVFDGKQVAVLVPTTLLAEQHYRTLKARFSGFPVRIESLSRFKPRDEAKASVAALAKGEIDIIVGTHMLLSKKIAFHDLGLLIIDEEHRFGVAQKERLKELKKNADVLTLTATPIPRTLYMSLSGIREMAVIETPPEERLAVKSIVTRFNDATIREAIQRELKRGGQVFFVHNRIRDIDAVAAYMRKLAPEARIAVAHGQMGEHELERIMLDFLNKRINLLVSTAIIGSGLDIPTANTLIVDRADTFGLSDLYQLRGRVGRGNLQAYAYFLIPGDELITEDAQKRLQALQEMSYLGAGFRLAMKDLEIRGAGNLLGPEQSGHIYKIGFDMYMDMLEKTVAELKGETVQEEIDTQVRLNIPAFIPEEYISDISLRLSMYKRISALKSADAVAELKDELSDRFGNIPEEVTNLLHIMKIKLFAQRLYIAKVVGIDTRYRFSFIVNEAPRYSIPGDFYDSLLKILFEIQSAKHKGRIRFMQDGFELKLEGGQSSKTLAALEDFLQMLAARLST